MIHWWILPTVFSLVYIVYMWSCTRGYRDHTTLMGAIIIVSILLMIAIWLAGFLTHMVLMGVLL